MVMKAWCIVDSDSVTQQDLDNATWTYLKYVDTNEDVDPTGTVLYNNGGGHYILENSTVERDAFFQVPVNGNLFEGVFTNMEATGSVTEETAQALTAAVGSLVSGTYSAGTVSNPMQVKYDGPITLHANTDYTGIIFDVGVQWSPFLTLPDVTAWFTVTSAIRGRLPILDASATISDPNAGIILLDLTATQTNLKIGNDLSWQLMGVQTIVTGNPPVTTYKRKIMLEGKLYLKPTFKV